MHRVVTFTPAPEPGDTVTMPADGAPALVLHRLPSPGGRSVPAVRVTTDPRCPACDDGRLVYGPPGAWTCPDCGDAPSPADLARIGRRGARRTGEHRARQIERGTPGAVALLNRAAEAIEAGADPAAWLQRLWDAPGSPERRAVRLALMRSGSADEPLSALRCRHAARLLDARGP